MSLLNKIYNWSLDQKPSIRDALRRLVQKSELTQDDYDDLYALAKIDAGIHDVEERTAIPLDKEHLPEVAAQDNAVKLLKIRKLKNVNRIAEGQELHLAPNGLTLIYGDNGTGKSGYSRILKSACRARDEKFVVLPNAHLPEEQQGTPEAEIVISLDGEKKKLSWNANQPDLPHMSTLSVFDSSCARAYLDAEQDVAYLPYGLDVIENLANVILPELNSRLSTEIDTLAVDMGQFDDVALDTTAGEFIESLSAKSDPAKLEMLANISNDEKARADELKMALEESDPKAKADGIRRLIKRLRVLKFKVEKSCLIVGAKASAKLEKLIKETEIAIKAEQISIQNLKSGEELLEGTGETEWMILFNSAKEYSKIAYPHEEFPSSSTGTKCLLCQQPLNDGGSRIQRFNEFIQNDASQNASSKRKQIEEYVSRLNLCEITFGVDESLAEEIDQHHEDLSSELLTLEKEIQTRKNWMVESAKNGECDSETSVDNQVKTKLVELILQLEKTAKDLYLSACEESRANQEKELQELNARQKLNLLKDQVKAAIVKYVLKEKMIVCSKNLRPLPVSRQSKALAQEAVTEALNNALNDEFSNLNIAHIKTKLKDRVKGGKTFHKIVLDVPKTHKLSDVLSEGELRMIAIASFLAEMRVSGHTGGAIFDDPVTSLDHFRRDRLAKRLVEESKRRQVVIFTHDTVFLGAIRSHSERDSAESSFAHLEWTTSEYSGYCHDGLPWHHQGYKDRIDSIEKQFRYLKGKWQPNPNSFLSGEMRQAYSHFRATIERAVEQIFLQNIVRRYENYIPVKEIKKVIGLTPDEADELIRLFNKASDVTEAHDPSSGANTPVPSPDDLEKDIEALKSLVDAFNKRRTSGS